MFKNWDLLSIGLVIASMAILGFSVYFSGKKNITHKTFLIFTIFTILWSSTNYLFYNILDVSLAFWILKLSLFFAVWVAFFLFTFFYVFPHPQINFPNWYKVFLFPLVLVISVSTLTPLILKEISAIIDSKIIKVVNGPLMPLFGILSSFLVFAGIFVLLRKMVKVEKRERKSFQLIFFGTLITFSLIIIFNLILPTMVDDSRFVSLGALFVFPFITFTSYAILRHRLFNIKVVGVALLVFLLSVVTFSEVIFAQNLSLIIYRGVVFVFVLFFGIFLIRGVLREVEQREKLATLNQKLQTAYEELDKLSRAKSEFISIASHQLRTPLTAIKGYVSMIIEGSYGKISERARVPLENVFKSNERLVILINDLLNISRIESGKIKLEPEKASIEEIINGVIFDLKINAEKKKLNLEFKKPITPIPSIFLDKDKMRQVILNLVDNAIKYTQKGGITIKLKTEFPYMEARGKKSAKKSFSSFVSSSTRRTKFSSPIENLKLKIMITDTGGGLAKDELGKIFQSFSRGNVGMKTHTEGAGLGLYIARLFVEMHNGKIWAESGGKDKGSTFYIELPVK